MKRGYVSIILLLGVLVFLPISRVLAQSEPAPNQTAETIGETVREAGAKVESLKFPAISAETKGIFRFTEDQRVRMAAYFQLARQQNFQNIQKERESENPHVLWLMILQALYGFGLFVASVIWLFYGILILAIVILIRRVIRFFRSPSYE